MTLGENLKLGYLECAGWNGNKLSPFKRSSSQQELANDLSPHPDLVFGTTLKIESDAKSNATAKLDSARSLESLACHLNWEHEPMREVQNIGHTRYRVSKAALPTCQRRQKLDLVRTTRLEPRPSSRSSSQQPFAGKNVERIHVKEDDFLRYANDINMLRQLQVMHPQNGSNDRAKSELELSFKSAFMKRCLSQDDPPRDPWKDLPKGPMRAHTEGDLILNQVWVPDDVPAKPKDVEERSSPLPSARRRTTFSRAASADAVYASRETAEGSRTRSNSRHQRHSLQEPRSARTPPSIGALENRRHRSALTRVASASRSRKPSCDSGLSPPSAGGRQRTAHRSGCPRPANELETTAKPKVFVDRIQPIDWQDYENSGCEEEELKGSYLVRAATRAHDRFVRRLDEESEAEQYAHLSRKVWVVLDPLSGEASLYPLPAATRIEGAFQNNRSTVPLSGLGGKYEDLMVYFGDNETGAAPVQKSISGEQADVRRFETPFLANEVCIHVTCDNTWRIVDEPISGKTEERRIALTGYELVRLPSPKKLPSINPALRSCYISQGAQLDY
jgi:hypothetical protein